jgi:fibronectin type 3 domain-containing protein
MAIHPQSYDSITVGDVDNDVDMEIVCGSRFGDIIIYNAYSGLIEQNISVCTSVLQCATLLDVNYDGFLELFAYSEGYLHCLTTPADSWRIPGPWSCYAGNNHRNANAHDSDSDQINDVLELELGLNPIIADTDQDGIEDNAEILAGQNPLINNILSTPQITEIIPNPSLSGNISLSWALIPGAINYTIYRDISAITTIFGKNPLDITEGNTYNDTQLLNGTYFYVVVASNSSGNSSFSNCVNVTVAIPPPPIYIPNTPLLYSIIPNPSTNGNISLSWSSISGVTFYYLFRDNSEIISLDGKTPTAILELNSYQDYGLVNGTYYYAVMAVNASGNSTMSNCRNVTVSIPPPPIYLPLSPIINPTYANTSSSGNFSFSWAHVPGATGYYIFRDNSVINSIDGKISICYQDQINFTDNGLLNGTYFYVVVASNSSGNSSLSNCVNVTVAIPPPPNCPPAPPTFNSITPNPSTTGNISLDWNDVIGVTTYFVYRETNHITSIMGLIPITTTTNSNYQDSGRSNGTYYYTIIAGNASGNSTMSNVESVVVAIPPPPQFLPHTPFMHPIVSNPSTNGSVIIEWDAVDGATSYKLYRSLLYISERNSAVILVNTTSTTSAVNSFLSNGLYYFVVTALNASGESNNSNCVNVTVQLASSPSPSSNWTVPQGFTIQLDGNLTSPIKVNRADIRWLDNIIPNAQNLSFYISTTSFTALELRSGNLPTYILVTTIAASNFEGLSPGDINKYQFTGLQNGTYFVCVTYANPLGQGFSNVLEFSVAIESDPKGNDKSNGNQFKVDGFRVEMVFLSTIISVAIVIMMRHRT